MAEELRYLIDCEILEHESDDRILALRTITKPSFDGRLAEDREDSQTLLLIPRTKKAVEKFSELYETIKEYVDLHSADDFFEKFEG